MLRQESAPPRVFFAQPVWAKAKLGLYRVPSRSGTEDEMTCKVVLLLVKVT